MPINSAAPTDTMMSASVSMLDSHRPNNPITENPAAATTAIRQPATTAATAAAPTITPRYVIRPRMFVIASQSAVAASLNGFRK